MKAMLLAAGRGERLRPFTDTIPKPLVCVRGKPLIVHHCERLAAAGFNEIVINLAYLGEKIKDVLKDGQEWGLRITYSHEGDTGLETGGGILNALPLLGNQPFVTINADILTDFDLSAFSEIKLPSSVLAHLILVSHTNNRPEGDFSLALDTSLVSNDFPRPYTVAGVTLYHPDFFKGLTVSKFSVTPLWRQYASEGKISGTVFNGEWHDVGTVEKLQMLNINY
jgi:MurNAc alpha-1-phosphate uridylyltransferase